MRSCASCPERGFTLMEMVLALAVTGLLVGVLVGAWVQVVRTASRAEQEAREERDREISSTRLTRLLDGIAWSGQSLTPQGTLRIELEGERLSFWSRESLGQAPGPVRWILEAGAGRGLRAWIEDPQVGVLPGFEAPELDSLRFEVLLGEIQTNGENLQWTSPQPIVQGSPFRPLAFRILLGRQGQGEVSILQRWL